MNKEYVELKEGAYRLVGSRVSLDSIVYEFLEGHSPESIRESFSTLSLEQVYGAIAFYLARREEIDAYLREGEALFEQLRERLRRDNPELTRNALAGFARKVCVGYYMMYMVAQPHPTNRRVFDFSGKAALALVVLSDALRLIAYYGYLCLAEVCKVGQRAGLKSYRRAIKRLPQREPLKTLHKTLLHTHLSSALAFL